MNEDKILGADAAAVDNARSAEPQVTGKRRRRGPRANAHLIAAAPDLLAACKEFVRKCECGQASSRKSYAEMTAAIKKAEGR